MTKHYATNGLDTSSLHDVSTEENFDTHLTISEVNITFLRVEKS